MKLEEIQTQALQLPVSDRWQLVQSVLESLKQENLPPIKQRNLLRLRGIAKTSETNDDKTKEDYVNYLIEKYQ